MVPESTPRVIEQGAKRLWIAALHQAIEDAKGNARSPAASEAEIRRLQCESLSWIFPDRSKAAHSFHAICDLLDIDPDWARQRLCGVHAIRRGLERAHGNVGEGEG